MTRAFASTCSRESRVSDQPWPFPTLPHYLRHGLRAVFVGYNPGLDSARAGHYYARPANRFWAHLSQSGLVPRPVSAVDDACLMDLAGIGLVDLCPRPTLRASELTAQELADGAARLAAQLREAEPAATVLNGRRLFEVFLTHGLGLTLSGRAPFQWGQQPIPPGSLSGALWVIPSSSGLASRWHALRLRLLGDIAQMLPGER